MVGGVVVEITIGGLAFGVEADRAESLESGFVVSKTGGDATTLMGGGAGVREISLDVVLGAVGGILVWAGGKREMEASSCCFKKEAYAEEGWISMSMGDDVFTMSVTVGSVELFRLLLFDFFTPVPLGKKAGLDFATLVTSEASTGAIVGVVLSSKVVFWGADVFGTSV
jgi:hypothetical protein